MNKTTNDNFPFLSYAKSVTRSLLEDRGQARSRQPSVTLAFTSRLGRPIHVVCPNGSVTPKEVSYLQVGPGCFDETVKDGLMELNRQRAERGRAIVDSIFSISPGRSSDIYVVAILSDFTTLSKDFYKFSCNGEFLLKPDENVLFYCISKENNTDQLTHDFKEAIEDVGIEIIPLTQAYDPHQPTLTWKLLNQVSVFYFHLQVGESLCKCSINLGNQMNWPLPCAANDTVIPRYFCKRETKQVNIKRLDGDEYSLFIHNGDKIDDGIYYVATEPENPAFALLVVRDGKMRFIVLPWNFTRMIETINAGIPSKEMCDAYLKTLPYAYVERVVQFFKENRWSYTNDLAHRQSSSSKVINGPHNDHIPNACVEFAAPDFALVDPSFSAVIMDQITMIRLECPVSRTGSAFLLNNDTIDDAGFSSLEQLKSKINPSKLYDRGQSTFSEDLIANLLSRKTADGFQEPNAKTVRKEDHATKDHLKLIEELVILLRDREFVEIEKVMQLFAYESEFLSVIKQVLLQSIDRFRIDKNTIPKTFMEKLVQT